MRIIIETDEAASQPVTVQRVGGAGQATQPDDLDGGGPPAELLEALGAEPPEEADQPTASAPEDGGEAASWLVDVIEGTAGSAGGNDGEA